MPKSGVKRRLSAILAADVVGYSRLMGEDETGTLERLKSVRRELVQPAITDCNGRIVKLMGDGLLAEFPSVVEAVQCAVTIQESLGSQDLDMEDNQRIRLRIGVNLGDILVEGSDIYGDGVNVAARLEGLAEPGGICISESVRLAMGNKLPLEYEFMGEQSVKNIKEPISVYQVQLRTDKSVGEDTPNQFDLELPDKPSIAVLPFNNMSSDAEQEYFSDGITEDIITELSHFQSLFVIARHSSFSYKGQAVDIRKIGHELGVRYVLEGSVRRDGESVRITAQLIEAQSGNHCWAERYDRQLDDIFAVQEEVSRTIAATLLGRVEQDRLELAKTSRPENLAAHDYLLRGKTRLYSYTNENIQTAINYFEKAVEISPEYAEAYAWLALCHSWQYAGWWSKDPVTSLDTALELALKSVEMDSTIGQVHGSLAYALVYKREYEQAMHHFGRAITLVPSDAENTSNFGWCMMFNGNPEKGLLWIEKGQRLNPLQEWWHAWLRGMVYYTMSQYDAALEAFGQLLHPPVEVEGWRSACYAQIGNIDRAKESVELFKGRAQAEFSTYPGDNDGGWRNYWCRTQPFRNIEDQEHLLEGLQKAGLPI